jgi:hypothetical protein
MIRDAWHTWVRIWDKYEHPRIQAVLRILVGGIILVDFLWLAILGLVVVLFGDEAAGGLNPVMTWSSIPPFYRLMPPTAASAWVLWGLVVVPATMVVVGFRTRAALVVLLLAYAQTALVIPRGDRGIDLMLRNVLLILVFSSCAKTWSVDAWRETGSWNGDGRHQPAWPRHLLILQLALMYFVAGIAKGSIYWTPMGEYAALYILLQDPAVARMDFAWIEAIYPLTQAATLLTILWEYSAPILLLFYWFRFTADRPGRFRAFCNRWPVIPMWLSVGVTFHVMIAATLELGIFPWAMLSLYPCFVHPGLLGRWLHDRQWTALLPAAPPGSPANDT